MVIIIIMKVICSTVKDGSIYLLFSLVTRTSNKQTRRRDGDQQENKEREKIYS